MFFICFSSMESLVTSSFACSVVSIGEKLSLQWWNPLQLHFHVKYQSFQPCNESPEQATLSFCVLKRLQTVVDNSDGEKGTQTPTNELKQDTKQNQLLYTCPKITLTTERLGLSTHVHLCTCIHINMPPWIYACVQTCPFFNNLS